MTTKDKLKRTVTEAIGVIQKEAATFTAKEKENYDPNKEDLVTSADTKAQAHYEEALRRDFPDFGLIGEEDGLHDLKPCYHTVDPLDGTKAFARRQSDSTASMLARVENGEVTGAYIGDINSGELYGFAPGDETVTRTRFGVETPLVIDTGKRIHKMYVQLCDPPYQYTPAIERITKPVEHGGIFKSHEVRGGSIGTNMARLWKDEIAALILLPNFETSGDSTPLIGINRKLGIKHLAIDPKTGDFEIVEPGLPTEVIPRSYIELMAHESRMDEIMSYLH